MEHFHYNAIMRDSQRKMFDEQRSSKRSNPPRKKGQPNGQHFEQQDVTASGDLDPMTVQKTYVAQEVQKDQDRASTSRNSVNFKGRCFKCQQSGHTKFQCPNKNVTCKTCNQKGHFSRECGEVRRQRSIQKTHTARMNTVEAEQEEDERSDVRSESEASNQYDDRTEDESSWETDYVDEDALYTLNDDRTISVNQYLEDLASDVFWNRQKPVERGVFQKLNPVDLSEGTDLDPSIPTAPPRQDLLYLKVAIEGKTCTLLVD
jgi:hypothetical protein